MRVKRIQWHLAGIEVELMTIGLGQHAQMNHGIFVSGEADVTDLARFFGIEHGLKVRCPLQRTGRDPQAGYFLVKLNQVDMAGLETLQRLVDLPGGGSLGPAIELSHEKGLLAIAVAESFSHADFALSVVVIPAIIEEIDAAIERGPDDGDADLGILRTADVMAPEANGGDFLAGVAELPIGHVVNRSRLTRSSGSQPKSGECGQCFTAVHTST